jgi:hypothetical protein
MTGRKIVIDDDVIAFALQHARCVTADVASAPNHENGQIALH